jgi:hypothetical protein
VAVEETLQQVNGQYPDPDSEPVLLTEDWGLGFQDLMLHH